MDFSRAAAGRGARFSRNAAIATAVGAAALLTAACGTTSAPGSAVPGQAASSAASRPPAAAGTRSWSAGQAAAYARQLLAVLPLPPGATVTTWPSAPVPLLAPSLPALLGHVVDVRVLYRVTMPVADVSSYLAAHRPAALQQTGTGSAGIVQRPGQRGAPGRPGPAVSPEPLATVQARYLDFAPRNLPAGLYQATLATVIAARPAGGSYLRADAQVAWYPPRSAAEYVTASQYRSVTVTRPDAGMAGEPVTSTYRTAKIIATLAAAVDRLHAAAGPGAISCPLMRAGSFYRLVFNPAAPDAGQIVVTPTGCLLVGVTAGGQRQPPLYPDAALITALHRLPAGQAGPAASDSSRATARRASS